ncbi:transcriptional regulator [Anaerococcus sp. Marseille-P3625]|uniref:transcriptional regulator n=1 Tax=Anaerococcus sp. Marseille-P3625 TaxID=1977277 RepID=UPI000C08D176|nr:transcriptional regulator [Anaerococcus sp. Marseille-P3625]
MLLNVRQVMEILNCSQSMAYKSIKILNKELEEDGFLTMQGRVPAEYLANRYKLDDEDIKKQVVK